MPRLLLINVASNCGSTGRIAENIGLEARKENWESYIAHGVRYSCKTELQEISIGSQISERIHYLYSLFFDSHGLGSKIETSFFIHSYLEKLRPDIVHLHNIHGYFINYPLLFRFLKKLAVPVVWTLHDCWSFTGHCTYFDRVGCEKWKEQCKRCPQIKTYPKALVDRSSRNFSLKKTVFSEMDKMTIIPVSEWLSGIVGDSFLQCYPRMVIHNGIDLTMFFPRSGGEIIRRFGGKEGKIVLGVADDFGARKGLDDFIKINNLLPSGYSIILVGVSLEDRKRVPSNILIIPRTSSQSELAELYSIAEVYVNPTYEDNFPTTNIEALACGTPVITYNTGGSPEAIDKETGLVVAKGDIKSLVNAIIHICDKGKEYYSKACRLRAERFFDKGISFKKYIDLYNQLLNV